MNRAMLQVYVAGAHSAPTPEGIKANIDEAAIVAANVYAGGAWPACPHLLGERFVGKWEQQRCLDGTLEWMRRCDAIVMVHNWRQSLGATAEHEEAVRLGMPVFYASAPEGYLPVEFWDWLKEQEGRAA
jgi:hypothetical protein